MVERLRADGKRDHADTVAEVGELARLGHITYLDQHGPYGNGTPVLNAARGAHDEPILVLWPDDVFVADIPVPSSWSAPMNAPDTLCSPSCP